MLDLIWDMGPMMNGTTGVSAAMLRIADVRERHAARESELPFYQSGGT